MASTKSTVVRAGQTLRNISIQCDAEIVSWHIAYSAAVLSDALVAFSGSPIVAKKLVTSGDTSSDTRIYGTFELKVSTYTFELNARYDDDNNVWQLTY